MRIHLEIRAPMIDNPGHGFAPNFLVIVADQMRADHLGCGGNGVIRTPNLDALANGGVLFSRAYLNNPLCMASRATLFTGLTPRGHRVRTNGIALDRSIPTVPGMLADAGYATACMGKVHLTPYERNSALTPKEFPPELFPEIGQDWKSGLIDRVPTPYYGLQQIALTIGHGDYVEGDWANWLRREHPEQWDRLKNAAKTPSPIGAEGCSTYPLDERFHHTAWVADRTIDYLSARETEKPFFLMASFPDPHHPYTVPRPWDTMYSRDEVIAPVAREGELRDLPWFMQAIYEKRLMVSGRYGATRMPEDHRREIIAYTYGMVSLMDHHIGRIIKALAENGLSENTIVLFISDHGDLMGDHGLLNKGPFHFEGLVRVPMIWNFSAGFTKGARDGLASLLDVPPTILDLAGVAIEKRPPSPAAGNEPPAWPGRSLSRMLRGEAAEVQDSVLIENDEDYLGLRLRTLVTRQHKITTYTAHRAAEPFGELFDLENDPKELHNLWADPAHQDLRLQLIDRLHHRLTETDIALPRRLTHA